SQFFRPLEIHPTGPRRYPDVAPGYRSNIQPGRKIRQVKVSSRPREDGWESRPPRARTGSEPPLPNAATIADGAVRRSGFWEIRRKLFRDGADVFGPDAPAGHLRFPQRGRDGLVQHGHAVRLEQLGVHFTQSEPERAREIRRASFGLHLDGQGVTSLFPVTLAIQFRVRRYACLLFLEI